MLPVPGVLEPVPGNRLVGIRGLSAVEILDPRIYPLFERVEQLAHFHIVFVDDLARRVAIGEHGVEAFADLPDFGGDRLALDAEMEVPVDVEVIVEVMPHERLSGELRVEKLVEEGHDLLLILRSIQVRRHRGEIDPLAEIVFAAVLQPLQEDGDALLGSGTPLLIDQSPEVVRKRILLGQRDVDHGQRGAFALIDARKEERDDDMLDIVVVEIARN